MLWMIQRVFYGDLGVKPEHMTAWDIDAREHLAMWPLLILFLVMGVAPPIWLRAIDTAGARIAATVPQTQQANSPLKLEANTAEGGQR